MVDASPLRFEPKYFAEKLSIVNPLGVVGVVTLWSRIDFVTERLRNAGVDFDAGTSRIAVLGNLYGEGFKYLLRNLLYNPQIRALVVFGRERSNSAEVLDHFFRLGVEPHETDVEYAPVGDRDQPKAIRVIGTDYVMDDLVIPDSFQTLPVIFRAAGVEDADAAKAAEFLESVNPENTGGRRRFIEVPEVKVKHFPSNVRGHTIIENSPSVAWKALVHRLFRFGRNVRIRKGERIELQNVKAVIEQPLFEPEQTIRECGFDPADFVSYQQAILSGELQPDIDYSYGHRIRSYFGLDCLDAAVELLRDGPDDRRSYISLWDDTTDFEEESAPCLVSLFFRKQDDLLHLSATYRVHNALKAWLENVYGLMAIQRYVADKIAVDTGAITVYSNSISLDPMYLEKAKAVHDEYCTRPIPRKDPYGYLRITTEADEIVVQHYSKSILLGEYRAKNPAGLQTQLFRNHVVSNINHAIYVGRQLEKARQCIEEGREFVQE